MKNIGNSRFSRAEELANAISHLIGVGLSIAALIVMLAYAINHGGASHIASAIVFGSSMILLYLSSSFNHILPQGKLKNFFFNFDQIAIYLLIAGTYTPLAIVALKGTLGWVIFGIEWGFAFAGILMKVFKPGKFEKGVNVFYMISYIIMGWMVLVAVPQVIDRVSVAGFLWILAGGLFYTVGTIFFKLTKFKFHHLVWHVMVLAGTASHFIAIYFYILRY